MGKYETNGGNFHPQGLLRINAGGSHDENPNGGVQLGVDQNNVPNMVEENEVVYDDYVYSDNIIADEAILEKNNLPTKYAGKLYSEIADILVDDPSIIPNDYISNNGLNKMLLRLAAAQEEQKQIAEKESLEEELANLSPEELAQLEQMLAQEAVNDDAQAQMQEQQMQETPVEQQMPMSYESPQMMANGGLLRVFEPGGEIPPKKGIPFNVNPETGVVTDENGNIPQYDVVEPTLHVYTDEIAPAVITDYHPFTLGVTRAINSFPSEVSEAVADMPWYSKLPAYAIPGLGTGLLSNEAYQDVKDENYVGAALAALPLFGKIGRLFKGGENAVSEASGESAKKINDYINSLTSNKAKLADAKARYKKVGNGGEGTRDAIRKEIEDLKSAIRLDEREIKHLGGTVPKTSIDDAARKTIGERTREFLHENKTGKIINGTLGTVLDPVYYYPRALARKGVGRGWRIAAGTAGAGQMALENYVLNNAFSTPSPLLGPDVKPFPSDYSGQIDGWDEYQSFVNSLPAEFADGGQINRFDIGGRSNPLGINTTLPKPKLNYSFDSLGRVVPVNTTINFDMDPVLNGQVSSGYQYRNPLDPISVSYNFDLTGKGDNTVKDNNTEKGLQPLSTALRYVGPATAGLMAMYNAAQPADKYNAKRIKPSYVSGNLNLIDPVYNPTDINQGVNTVLAGGAGTMRGLRNSGAGPSAGAMILSGDYNLGRNIGAAVSEGRKYNNTLLNNVIGMVNANRAAKANFDAGISEKNAGIFNSIADKNSQRDLLEQQLNYQSEAAKYQAISTEIDQLAKALSGIGRENFVMNQINSNRALLYRNGPDGWGYYDGEKKIS